MCNEHVGVEVHSSGLLILSPVRDIFKLIPVCTHSIVIPSGSGHCEHFFILGNWLCSCEGAVGCAPTEAVKGGSFCTSFIVSFECAF